VTADNVVKLPAQPTPILRGWHGMTQRPQKCNRGEDWRAWSELGDDARLVDSARDSPAWRSDIRGATWVLSLNGMSFEAFERSGASIGDTVEVRAFSQGLGSFTRTLVLVEVPLRPAAGERRRNRAQPLWSRERPVLPGKQVHKAQRTRYMEFVAQHPHVRRHVWFLSRLMKHHWHRGIIPRHATIATAAGVSASTVKLAQRCCCHFGFVRITSGKRAHRHNSYEVCWPAGSEPN